MLEKSIQTDNPIQHEPTESDDKCILVSFNDGSYKKIKHIEWKHSQWIHFIKINHRQIHVNPKNVNYMEEL